MKIYLKILYFIIAIIILYLAVPPVVHAAVVDNTTGYIWGRAMMPDDTTGIAGCEVQLLGRDDQLAAKAVSDADGNFIFTNLPPNDATWGYRLIVKRGNWGQSVTQQFSVFADSATQVAVRVYPFIGSFTLTATNSTLAADGSSRVGLTVALLDVDGKPVPDGVHVRLTQSSPYPNPGRFFSGAVNGTEVVLSTAGGRAQFQYGDVPRDTLSRGVSITAAGVEAAGVRSLNLTLDLVNPNAIEGTVYDATGLPVPYARVYLSRWDGVSQYVGYNSTADGVVANGSGTCDARGHYRFAVMPAGDYRVNASEASFANTSRVTVVSGTYKLDIRLPMGHSSIKGWVRDSKDHVLAGANVTLYRVYGDDLSLMDTNTSDADGAFRFDDIWWGKYAVQAVYAGQTATVTVPLDKNPASVTLAFLVELSNVTPAPSMPAKVTPAISPGASVTPRPPAPTPPAVSPSYILSTYGVAFAVMALIGVGVLFITLRMRP